MIIASTVHRFGPRGALGGMGNRPNVRECYHPSNDRGLRITATDWVRTATVWDHQPLIEVVVDRAAQTSQGIMRAARKINVSTSAGPATTPPSIRPKASMAKTMHGQADRQESPQAAVHHADAAGTHNHLYLMVGGTATPTDSSEPTPFPKNTATRRCADPRPR